jgi:DNA-binding SARP family transcriptional activator
LWARGRALAWTGTEEATLQADRLFVEVAARCRAMGNDDWLGFILFWRGYTTFYRHGNPQRGGELMREALDVLGPQSVRRSTVLSFYAEVLGDLGDWDAADVILTEARELADRDGDPKSRAYVAWTRARIASARGDALTTERLVREVEREPGDWLRTDGGISFLADAAEMLDRVGLAEQAQIYLHRAQTHPARDEDCAADQANATLLARSGDPVVALTELQKLTRGDWIEKRLMWRHRLLIAWATFRSAREGAGELAALALEEAARSGGVQLALVGEPELTQAMLPPAEEAGSAHARTALLDGRVLLVRLFGTTRVLRADGTLVGLPPGQPGELVRMLSLHEHGLPVDVVLEAFFPGAPVSASRHRLRQILTRLRTAAGELVIRDGDSLRLLPAWVDVREFIIASNRVRALSGSRAVQFAYAALALWSGPLLPASPYASWAEEIRVEVDDRLVELLDLIIADARRRGSHQEALTALTSARALDPDDPSRHPAMIEHLTALGRHSAAQRLARQFDT